MGTDSLQPVSPYTSSISGRHDQAFPRLTESEIARIARFGERRQYHRGERVFAAGEPPPGMFVVLKGTLTMSSRDGLGRVVPIVRHDRGNFTGEVAQLSGGLFLVDADAEDEVEALLFPPDRLRALIVAEADLGERIVRALILRRVAHIQTGASGPVLIGKPQAPDMLRLQNFLQRKYGAGADDMLVVCPNGAMSLTPSEESLGHCLGMLDVLERDELFDVAVVGAGPAGLSWAVEAWRMR